MTAAATHPLSQALDSTEERVKGFSTERQQLVTELKGVIERAQALLSSLGESEIPFPRRGRRPGRPAGTAKRGPGRPRKSSGKRGRPKGFKMSEEAKQKMRDAWARRKALGKAGKKK